MTLPPILELLYTYLWHWQDIGTIIFKNFQESPRLQHALVSERWGAANWVLA